jgi:hypothetical protein
MKCPNPAWDHRVSSWSANRQPQWAAIGIAIVSFVLWIAALPGDSSPVDLGAQAYLAGLAALIWATVPVFFGLKSQPLK